MNVFQSLKSQIKTMQLDVKRIPVKQVYAKTFSKVANLAATIWPPESILSGKVCQTLELTDAEQRALPWLQESANNLATLQSLPAGQQASGHLWDASKVAFAYEMPVSHWVQAFKYHAQVERGRLLADLFAKHFQLQAGSKDLVDSGGKLEIERLIPVPMHWRRYRQRGFNQSLHLAKRLSAISGIPVAPKVIQRVRDTPPQASLDAKQRHKNLRQAFTLDVDALQNIQSIALVDDVVTTGATMNEIIKLIREQTAIEWVEVWAIAQA